MLSDGNDASLLFGSYVAPDEMDGGPEAPPGVATT